MPAPREEPSPLPFPPPDVAGAVWNDVKDGEKEGPIVELELDKPPWGSPAGPPVGGPKPCWLCIGIQTRARAAQSAAANIWRRSSQRRPLAFS
eukprot:scaffold3350_cov268-Pinguiococcus_pyrenoidosus.AAC.27